MTNHQEHGRHAGPPRQHRRRRAAAAVALVLAALLGAWWLAELLGAGSPDGTGGTAAQESTPVAVTSAQTAEASSRGTVDSALRGCRSRHTEQRPTLVAARASLRQWDVHIAAMNRLVAGEITLDQAVAFWEATRRGAAERVSAFRGADRAYRAEPAGCAPVGADLYAAAVGTAQAQALRSCTTSIAARDEQLTAARPAIETWRSHIRDMELFRAGKMTAEEATRKWLMHWRHGVEQLRVYDAAARGAARTDC